MKRTSDDAWIYEAFSRETELPASFSQRLADACDTVRRDSRGKEPEMNKHTRKSMRVALLWAAAAVILSLSAFAVYQRTMGDAVLPEPTAAAEAEAYGCSQADNQRLHMSLNGFSDSPEYQAYAAWTAWNDAWKAENPDPWNAIGVGDTYFEGPENYAYFYEAEFTEQGEKLDEILAEYDLTPHIARCWINSAEDLCSLLGEEDLLSEELPLIGGYMYDDGSFKIEGIEAEGDSYRDATVFFARKGSFSMISGFMPADYEEWTYITADGTEVLLALGHAEGTPAEPEAPQDRGCLLAELAGGYVYAGFGGVKDKAELERYADDIGLAALDERFAPGADTSDIAAAVEARYEEMRSQMEQDAADMYAPFADKAERDAAVFADLGHYTITDLPEGYEFLYDSAEWKGHAFLAWDASDEMGGSTLTYGGSTWRGDSSDGIWRFLHLSYQRYYARNDLETVTNETEFENVKAYYQAYSEECTETTVNGCDALLVRDEWGTPGSHYLLWFDTDRGLQFTLSGECFDETGNLDLFTDEDLLAMGESVVEG